MYCLPMTTREAFNQAAKKAFQTVTTIYVTAAGAVNGFSGTAMVAEKIIDPTGPFLPVAQLGLLFGTLAGGIFSYAVIKTCHHWSNTPGEEAAPAPIQSYKGPNSPSA